MDGHVRVERVLLELEPYIHFKQPQVVVMFKALALLKQEQTPERFLAVCRLADELSEFNYTSNRKYTAACVEEELKRRGFLSP